MVFVLFLAQLNVFIADSRYELSTASQPRSSAQTLTLLEESCPSKRKPDDVCRSAGQQLLMNSLHSSAALCRSSAVLVSVTTACGNT